MAKRSQILLFLGAVTCISMSMGVHESILNNFLTDTYDVSAEVRGRLEFPREFPGLLVVLMAGLLAALPVTRLGVVGGVVLAAGLVGMAHLGGSWRPMLAMMVLSSAGMHLLMPVGSSIAIGLSDSHNRGLRMGQMGAIGTVGMLLGSGFVWLSFGREAPPYALGFLCAGIAAGVGALLYGLLHIPHLHQPRSRLVVRRKFWLYYLLELFFGARKQIFITFGPLVLIRVYGEPAKTIAALMTIAGLIGVGFKPLVGMAIDRFGERVVLVADGLVLAMVCIGYGYARELTGDDSSARLLVCVCFVLDNLLFSLGTGRAVYVSRLTDSPQELTSTLAVGISVNHAVSMSIPALAGAMWMRFGHGRVFLLAAVLAVAIALLASLVPGKGARKPTAN